MTAPHTTPTDCLPEWLQNLDLGRYLLRRLLGEGGMGIVVEAHDCLTGAAVAVKLMKPALASEEGYRLRFRSEAALAAKVVSEFVVPVLDSGEDDRIPYLVMPLLIGESLAARLAREPSLTCAEILRAARETAEGLSAAHALGVIHRDIKPSNIFLANTADDWHVRIVDFGLATRRDDPRLSDGGLAGTILYMSPERLMCVRGDAPCDVYALGVTLYESFLGTPMIDRSWGPIDACPELHGELGELIKKMLEFNPRKRPKINKVIEALAELEKNCPATATGFVPVRRSRAAMRHTDATRPEIPVRLAEPTHPGLGIVAVP